MRRQDEEPAPDPPAAEEPAPDPPAVEEPPAEAPPADAPPADEGAPGPPAEDALPGDVAPPGAPANNTTIPNLLKEPPQTFYEPIFILTAIFGAIFIIGPLLVRKGPNRGITRWCIMLTSFCMWIFWTTMYISQMNPLMGPRLHNASLAWVGHKWGKNAKSLASPEEAR